MRHYTITLCLAALCLLALAACNKDGSRLPNELLGSWTTDEPAYRNRALKLEREYVLIGVGQDVTPTVQKITKVETISIDSGIACTIYSADKEGQHQLTVYFNPKEPRSIFLKNVPGKWNKS
jgi:hypothetical protein